MRRFRRFPRCRRGRDPLTGFRRLSLTAFELGKLKIAAHVREELERAGIPFEAIHCKSGGLQARDTARLVVTVNGSPVHVDLEAREVEDCESIVAGEAWYKIAEFVGALRRAR